VKARTAEKQRVDKLLVDAQIKLSVVVSDIFGVSGRQMLAVLIDGQRDPTALAQLARGVMRRKITMLQEAFTGYFTAHPAFLLEKMLARVDAIGADIAALDTSIEQMATPFTAQVRRLSEIPDISFTAACAILAVLYGQIRPPAGLTAPGEVGGQLLPGPAGGNTAHGFDNGPHRP
jgi:transposase